MFLLTESDTELKQSITTGSTEHTWQPTMTSETNIPSYWLNWRFFVCAIFVLTSLFLSSYLIWRYEGPIKRKKRGDDQSLELEQLTGVVYDDESWNTSVKEIHPNWLLGFRVFGFVVLLGLISGNAIADGTGIFIFYTQWTFTLVTIYFGVWLFFTLSCLDHWCPYTDLGLLIMVKTELV